MFAAEATQSITFKEGTGTTSDGSAKLNTIESIIAEGSEFVSAIPTANEIYNARVGRGIKLGSSKNPGSLVLTLASPVKPTKITFAAHQYNDSETSITVNGKDIDVSVKADPVNGGVLIPIEEGVKEYKVEVELG